MNVNAIIQGACKPLPAQNTTYNLFSFLPQFFSHFNFLLLYLRFLKNVSCWFSVATDKITEAINRFNPNKCQLSNFHSNQGRK